MQRLAWGKHVGDMHMLVLKKGEADVAMIGVKNKRRRLRLLRRENARQQRDDWCGSARDGE